MIPLAITLSQAKPTLPLNLELEYIWKQEALDRQHTTKEDSENIKPDYDESEGIVLNPYTQVGIEIDQEIQKDLYNQKERLRRNTSHLLVKENKRKVNKTKSIKPKEILKERQQKKRRQQQQNEVTEEVASRT